MNYKVWNKQDSLITPIGEVLTPQDVFSRFPASQLADMKYVISSQPVSMSLFVELEQFKSVFRQQGVSIPDDALPSEALAIISEWENTPKPQLPSVEERIASAMEFEMLLKMQQLGGQ